MSKQADNSPAKADEKQKPTPASEAKPNKATTNNAKATKSWLPWLLVLILVAAIAAAGWAGYRYVYQELWQQSAELTQRNAELQEQIHELNEQVARQQKLIEEVPSRIQSNMDSLSRVVGNHYAEQKDRMEAFAAQVDAVQAELAGLDISQATQWRVMEARHLAARAAEKLYIDRSPKAAIALLDLADSHLAALDNPAHQQARQALANDRMQLAALPDAQATEVARQLGALRAQLASAPWYQQQVERLTGAASQQTTDDWWQNFKNSLQKLADQLIKVQRRDQPVQPLLAEGYSQVLQQRTLLQLQLAQQAALSDDQALYQQTIAQAIALLTSSADESTVTVQQMLEILEQLQNVELAPEYPIELSSPAQLERLARQVSQEANA